MTLEAADPSAGRLERRKARTRAAILEAAARLFQAHGYDGASIQQIAEAADTGVGTVYGYFASKDEILQEVLRVHSEEAIERYRAAIGEDTTAIDRVVTAFETTAQFIREHRTVLRAMLQAEMRVPAGAEHPMDWLYQAYAALIQQGIERGEVRPVDVDTVVRTIISTCSMAMLGMGAWRGREDEPATTRELAALIRLLLSPPAANSQPRAATGASSSSTAS